MTLRFNYFSIFSLISCSPPRQNNHRLLKPIHTLFFYLKHTESSIWQWIISCFLKADIFKVFHPQWHCYLMCPEGRAGFLSFPYYSLSKPRHFPEENSKPCPPMLFSKNRQLSYLVIVCLSKLLPTPYSSHVPLWFHSLIQRVHLGQFLLNSKCKLPWEFAFASLPKELISVFLTKQDSSKCPHLHHLKGICSRSCRLLHYLWLGFKWWEENLKQCHRLHQNYNFPMLSLTTK